jgi:hypothetical protein
VHHQAGLGVLISNKLIYGRKFGVRSPSNPNRVSTSTSCFGSENGNFLQFFNQ